MRACGIDGYKGGWIAVAIDSGSFGRAQVSWDSSLSDLVEHVSADMSLIDIPIGLSSGPNDRIVEQVVRGFMPGKTSSVFNSPCRQALEAKTYEDAKATNLSELGKSLSKQSWSIFPKIKEADLLAQSAGQQNAKEGHPEASFTVYRNGAPILASKKSAKGLFSRIAALSEIGFEFSGLADDLPNKHNAAADDLIDAAILAWSANRVLNNNHRSFPEHPVKDNVGLEMAILA